MSTTVHHQPAAAGGMRWRRIAIGAVLLEAALLAGAVPLFDLVETPFTATPGTSNDFAAYLAICSIPPTTIAAVIDAYGPFWFLTANGLRIGGAVVGAGYAGRPGACADAEDNRQRRSMPSGTDAVATGRRFTASVSALIILPLALIAAGAVAFAQGVFREAGVLRGEQGDPADIPPPELPDRNITGCHLHYTSVRAESNGSGWRTDYPWAQRNLMIRLSELTRARVSWKTPGIPYVWLVSLTDPALFECPYLMASDVGTIGLAPDEVEPLRRYLAKGGFLWVDDFWGEDAWEQWSTELTRALPAGYTVEEIPLSDPIFHTMFEVRKVPQVPGIGYWRRSRGAMTSERGEATAEVHFRAIRDEAGRIVSVMTHNTDISNSWERETEDPEYFHRFSVDGYGLGLNVVLYALTH